MMRSGQGSCLWQVLVLRTYAPKRKGHRLRIGTGRYSSHRCGRTVVALYHLRHLPMQALLACTFTQLRLCAVRQFICPPMHGRTGDKVVLIALFFFSFLSVPRHDTIYFYYFSSLTWHILWSHRIQLTSSFRHYFDTSFLLSQVTIVLSYFKCIHSGQHFYPSLPHSTALGYHPR